ncbi:hypothetical protein [Bdellovibrio sp. HCB274]|uniref:hypothetical protein n=1 Tax=Bdellovibrio sp. HCB274 TaxID=3394361 RepID=UPI0039B5910F
MKLLISTLLFFISSISFATPGGYGAGQGHGGKTGPCQKVKTACETAGFVGGDRNAPKKLWKDCVDPLMAGKSVKGVSVSAADVEACKMK